MHFSANNKLYLLYVYVVVGGLYHWINYLSLSLSLFITKTYLHNFDPLKPHFYIVKLGFIGVYIIFLISAQQHRLWVLVRTASVRRFERVPTIYVLSRNMKNIRIFIWKFSFFWVVKFSIYLNRRVFVMSTFLFGQVYFQLKGCLFCFSLLSFTIEILGIFFP